MPIKNKHNEKFRDFFRVIKKNRGVTYLDIANESGVDYKTVQNMGTGQVTSGIERYGRVADGMGMTSVERVRFIESLGFRIFVDEDEMKQRRGDLGTGHSAAN